MKRIFLLILCLLFVLSACMKNERAEKPELIGTPSNEEPFVGVWLTYSELSVKGKNHTEDSYRKFISNLFDEYKAKGINNVFVHARPFADALYASELFESSEYASGKRGEKADFDILSICVDEGQKRNLKMHAWINPYRVSANFKDDFLTKGIIKDWYEKEGNLVCRVSGGLYLNPASPKVQKLIVDGIREILQKYEVDGIHFDDYFYPSGCGNFDKNEYKSYRKNGGQLSLEDFRRENVNTLMSLCYSAVKSFGEEKIFSVSPSGDIEKNYSEIFADVALWCKDSYCDMIIPQLYYGFLNETKPFERVLDEWVKLCENSPVKLVAGLALYKVGEEDEFAGKGKDEWLKDTTVIKRQTEKAAEKNCYGIAYFSSSYLQNINF